MYRILILLFPVLFGYSLSAQEDLSADSAFFLSQKDLYQRWLEHEGISDALRVQDLLVEPERLTRISAFTPRIPIPFTRFGGS